MENCTFLSPVLEILEIVGIVLEIFKIVLIVPVLAVSRMQLIKRSRGNAKN